MSWYHRLGLLISRYTGYVSTLAVLDEIIVFIVVLHIHAYRCIMCERLRLRI